jgi:hypothetical protein
MTRVVRTSLVRQNLDVNPAEHFGGTLIELVCSSNIFESGEEVVDADALLFSAAKILDNSPAMRHDEAVAEIGSLVHGVSDH